MAEILGLGLTHYPPLCVTDDKMAWIMERALKDPGVPPSELDPANWPPAMRLANRPAMHPKNGKLVR